MKVDIPKNLWLNSATVDFFTEGLHQGVLGLTLGFTGNQVGSIELMSEILEPLTSLVLPKRKIVRLKGLFDKQDTGLPLAVQAFRSWGFQVHAIVDVPQLDLPWLKDVDWLVVKTTKPFVPVGSNELWYYPPQGDEVPPEPKIPNPDRTLLYFAKGYSMTQTTKFITNAKHNWALL